MNVGDHPLSGSSSDLTAEELDQRYNLLLTRYNAARRMGMDQGVLYQLDLLISGVELEREKRRLADEKGDGVVLDTDPITLPQFKPTRNK